MLKPCTQSTPQSAAALQGLYILSVNEVLVTVVLESMLLLHGQL